MIFIAMVGIGSVNILPTRSSHRPHLRERNALLVPSRSRNRFV